MGYKCHHDNWKITVNILSHSGIIVLLNKQKKTHNKTYELEN